MPSESELAQERIIRNGLLLDVCVWIIFVALAIWTRSLTILAEALQSGITLGLTSLSIVVLRRVNRGRLADYDFGTGKVEQAVSILTAFAMVGGAVFVLLEIPDHLLHPPVHEGTALTVALAIVLADLVIDASVLAGMIRAGRGAVSPVVEAERKARLSRTIASGMIAVSVATNAAFGGAVGMWADAAGSAFVSLFMVWLASGMIRRILPDLLDKALGDELQVHINRGLAAHFESYETLGRVRSRRTGSQILVEIELGFDADLTLGEVVARMA
ncbi:MAG: cation diffusion facilitator family transporter, partial [Alphaproteobacteria bacterium]